VTNGALYHPCGYPGTLAWGTSSHWRAPLADASSGYDATY